MALTSITLNGFKSIRRLDHLSLGRINVLIGANGAGKSNLIAFFRLLREIMGTGSLQLSIARMEGANACLHDGAAVTPQLETQLLFETDEGSFEYSARLVHGAADTLIFAVEEYCFTERIAEKSDAHRVQMGTGHRETLLRMGNGPREPSDREQESVVGRLLRLLQGCEVHQFHNTSDTARIRQRWSVVDGQILKEDGGNLAPVLLRLRTVHPPAYRRIAETIRQIIPFFADFVLDPDGDTTLLRWQERGTDMVFGPHQASDGTLRIMALVALLLQPKESLPDVLILDEPELGLHPFAINVVAGLIKSVAVHKQVILATQSTALLDHFDPEDVITVNRHGRESVFERLDPARLQEWLEEYSLAELWEKNVIGGRPNG